MPQMLRVRSGRAGTLFLFSESSDVEACMPTNVKTHVRIYSVTYLFAQVLWRTSHDALTGVKPAALIFSWCSIAAASRG